MLTELRFDSFEQNIDNFKKILLDKNKNMIYFTGNFGSGKSDFIQKFFDNYDKKCSDLNEIMSENYAKNNIFVDKKNFSLDENKKVNVHKLDASYLVSNSNKAEGILNRLIFRKKWLWTKSKAYKVINCISLCVIAVISALFLIFTFLKDINDNNIFSTLFFSKPIMITSSIILLLGLLIKIFLIAMKYNVIDSTFLDLFRILGSKGSDRIFYIDDLNRINLEEKKSLYLLISSLASSKNKFIVVDSINNDTSNLSITTEEIHKFFDVLIYKEIDSEVKKIIIKDFFDIQISQYCDLHFLNQVITLSLDSNNIRLIFSFIQKLKEYNFNSFIFNHIKFEDLLILHYCKYFREEIYDKIKKTFRNKEKLIENKNFFDFLDFDEVESMYSSTDYKNKLFLRISETFYKIDNEKFLFSFAFSETFEFEFFKLLENGELLENFSNDLKKILDLDINISNLKKIDRFIYSSNYVYLQDNIFKILERWYSVAKLMDIYFLDFPDFELNDLSQNMLKIFVKKLKANLEDRKCFVNEFEKGNNKDESEITEPLKFFKWNAILMKLSAMNEEYNIQINEKTSKFIEVVIVSRKEPSDIFLKNILEEIVSDLPIIFNDIKKNNLDELDSDNATINAIVEYFLKFKEVDINVYEKIKIIFANKVKEIVYLSNVVKDYYSRLLSIEDITNKPEDHNEIKDFIVEILNLIE